MLPQIKNLISKAFLLGALFLVLSGGVMTAKPVRAQSTAEERAQLQSQLDEIEKQIAVYEQELSVTKTQKNTLANKIKQLKAQQSALRLQIQQTTLKITGLEKDLTKTKSSIAESIIKLEDLKTGVADLLRQINSSEQTLVATMLISNTLGEAYVEIKNYDMLTQGLGRLLTQTKEVKAQLEDKKVSYEDQQDDAKKLLAIKAAQQGQLVLTLSEQNDLLTETKGKESNYQTLLADQKKRAAEIRSRIYELYSMTTQITFGQALEIAKWASSLTSVRPAFLLAILTQESNLGKNVGTCNRMGDPPEKSWKVVMKPTRDQEPFKIITAELGLDIDTTPVSCPMRDKNGNQVGWGGAMGPAQFIPSTWMGWRGKVAALTGKATANPWDIRDAFLASALKLKSNGANDGGNGEWKAAMIYFSGSTNTRYRFYGDNVLATAKKYQADIDELD